MKKHPKKGMTGKRPVMAEETLEAMDIDELNRKVVSKGAEGFEKEGNPYPHPLNKAKLCQNMVKPFPPATGCLA